MLQNPQGLSNKKILVLAYQSPGQAALRVAVFQRQAGPRLPSCSYATWSAWLLRLPRGEEGGRGLVGGF